MRGAVAEQSRPLSVFDEKVIMKTRVDETACQGHAMCALACPEVFHTDDETGHAFVISESVAPEHEASVVIARGSCPEEAIKIF
jgi:ferredoxin